MGGFFTENNRKRSKDLLQFTTELVCSCVCPTRLRTPGPALTPGPWAATLDGHGEEGEEAGPSLGGVSLPALWNMEPSWPQAVLRWNGGISVWRILAVSWYQLSGYLGPKSCPKSFIRVSFWHWKWLCAEFSKTATAAIAAKFPYERLELKRKGNDPYIQRLIQIWKEQLVWAVSESIGFLSKCKFKASSRHKIAKILLTMNYA